MGASKGDNPAWEENDAGSITTSFVTGPLGILATYSSGTPTYLVANGHGDIIQTRNASGGLVEQYSYDDAGDVTSTQKPTRYGYVGQWQKDREEDSSMIRMGVRFYDPLVGRFASWDPVDGGGLTSYEYAGQNPANRYDLDGRCWQVWQKRCRGHKSWISRLGWAPSQLWHAMSFPRFPGLLT